MSDYAELCFCPLCQEQRAAAEKEKSTEAASQKPDVAGSYRLSGDSLGANAVAFSGTAETSGAPQPREAVSVHPQGVGGVSAARSGSVKALPASSAQPRAASRRPSSGSFSLSDLRENLAKNERKDE